MLVTDAAKDGSEGAANFLGNSFEHGTDGLPKDLARAKAWYEKVASAKLQDLDADSVKAAAARVRELSA